MSWHNRSYQTCAMIGVPIAIMLAAIVGFIAWSMYHDPNLTVVIVTVAIMSAIINATALNHLDGE